MYAQFFCENLIEITSKYLSLFLPLHLRSFLEHNPSAAKLAADPPVSRDRDPDVVLHFESKWLVEIYYRRLRSLRKQQQMKNKNLTLVII